MLDKVLELNRKTDWFDKIEIIKYVENEETQGISFEEHPEDFYVVEKRLTPFTNRYGQFTATKENGDMLRILTLVVIHKKDVEIYKKFFPAPFCLGTSYAKDFGKVIEEKLENNEDVVEIQPLNLNGYESHDPDIIYNEKQIVLFYRPDCSIKFNDGKNEFYQGEVIKVHFGDKTREKYIKSAFWVTTFFPEIDMKYIKWKTNGMGETHSRKMMLMGMEQLDDGSIKGWGFLGHLSNVGDKLFIYHLLEFYTKEGDTYSKLNEEYQISTETRVRNNAPKQGLIAFVIIAFFIIGLFGAPWAIFLAILTCAACLFSSIDNEDIKRQKMKQEDFFQGGYGYNWMKNADKIDWLKK